MTQANNRTLRYSTLTVTPQVASEILAGAVAFQNRAVKRWRVDGYAADMLAGRWRPNGEVLVFDESGVLIDGQHRLHAVVKAGVTLEMQACYGVARDDAATIDQGCSRTISDALTMDGASNVVSVVATARALHTFRSNVDPDCETGKRHNPDACMSTAGGVEQFLLANPGLHEAFLAIPRDLGKIIPASTLAGAAYELAILESESVAMEFVLGIRGDGVPRSDARVLLRDRMIDDRLALAERSRRGRAIARSKTDHLALIVMAWNAWASGDTVGRTFLQLGHAREYKIPVPMTVEQSRAYRKSAASGFSRGSVASVKRQLGRSVFQ